MFVCTSEVGTVCMRTCSLSFRFQNLIFNKPQCVSVLAATSEEKNPGPAVNGRKGKWSEWSDVVFLLREVSLVTFISSSGS